MGWVLQGESEDTMFFNVNAFTLVFYTAGMLVLGMVNLFQAKMSPKGLRTKLSFIQGIVYGGVMVYFLIVILNSQELTPAFKLWVGLLFMILFQVEVIEATLLYSNPEKYLPERGEHIKDPSADERFKFVKKLFKNQDPMIHHLNVIISLILALGALAIHLMIITDFLFI